MLRRGVVCARLQVAARTEDGIELVRTWSIDGAPTAAELTDRVRWQLEGWLSGRSGRPPSAPLTHLELVAQEVSPAGAVQDGLWGRARRGEAQAGRAALRVAGVWRGGGGGPRPGPAGRRAWRPRWPTPGIRTRRSSRTRRTLEDTFLDLTGRELRGEEEQR
ncbi:hypothetical protein [Georgenia sp. SUBG003]|uniref:hypothetical protein n=1 Tax=Georgenia sp. SUBG003 TaxID=1497974 RepID=UPI003AB3BB56